jgi:hypothetical protein
MATVDTTTSLAQAPCEDDTAHRVRLKLTRGERQHVERLRLRLFRAMSFVETTERALGQHDQLSERDVLREAYKAIGEVAEELEGISGWNEPLDEEAQS